MGFKDPELFGSAISSSKVESPATTVDAHLRSGSKNWPRITLVTPVFNGARYLCAMLESLRIQKYPSLEYIVCDGGSTDGTLKILEENRDMISHLIVGKDRGMYDALMKGFALATGDIWGWLNADDLHMPWCLRCVAAYMQYVPDCQWLTGIPSICDGDGRVLYVAHVAPYYRRSLIRRRWYSGIGLNYIQQESTFFSRELFKKTAGLDTDLRVASDFQLWVDFAAHADLHQVGTVLAAFRMHRSNRSADSASYLNEARAVRIPFGRILFYTDSYLMFLFNRWRKRPRLADLLKAKPCL